MINRFNIVRSVGLIFFGLGMFFVGVSAPELLYDGFQRGWGNEYEFYVLFSLGIGFFISGVGGFFKVKWFPISGRLILLLSFFAFHWFFFETILPDSNRRGEFYLSIALLITVYILISTFFLMMGNESFLKALEKKEEEEYENEEILDAE